MHLSVTNQDGAKKDLQSFVETFFREDATLEAGENDSKPTILYSSYFEIPSSTKGIDTTSDQNGPIYACCGPFVELDYDESIRQSRLLYEKMYPDDEFLPKAPEPEEIIIGDEDATESNVNLGALSDFIGEEKVEEKAQEQEPSKDLPKVEEPSQETELLPH